MGGALQLWLPVERFDEGMLLLRHTLHWELVDITYAVLFDSRRSAATRWDGRKIKPTPKASVRIWLRASRVPACACVCAERCARL
jgi:hypothetical protein